MSELNEACSKQASDGDVGFRTGALFVILITSLVGTMFPIASKRVPWLNRHTPAFLFEFAKFFGSGVILATGIIHLLEPATDDLGEDSTISAGGCIPDAWADYPYAFAFCLAGLFLTFLTQMVAFRLGSAKLARLGLAAPAHAHSLACTVGAGHNGEALDVDRTSSITRRETKESKAGLAEEGKLADSEKAQMSTPAAGASTDQLAFHDASEQNPALAQSMGVATLEFGTTLHSVIIGLTLATTREDEFNILFIVLIFHQMFEGLGLGARLAFLDLAPSYGWVAWAGAVVYSACTPVGMAVGLAVREGLAMQGAAASIVAGVLNSVSAGILLYTGVVELMAHELIFSRVYLTCPWSRLWFVLGSFAAGAGLMALLAKWA
ncbi:hypothetical protein JCM10207_003960 [Rhodosporidiobolus poonsookiae]